MDFRLANVALDIFCTLVSLVLMVYTLSQAERKKLNGWFIGICLCNIGMLIGDLPNWLCEGFAQPWFPLLLNVGILVQFLSGGWISMAYTGYLVVFLSQKIRVAQPYLYIAGLLGAAATTSVILNLWNGMFYVIDHMNIYHRGDLWWFSQVIPILVMGLDIVIVLHYHSYMTRKTVTTFLAYQLLPLPAIVLQGLFYGLACTYPATTLALIIIFLNIQAEQSLLIEQQKSQVIEADISVMLSQIQPHFLFNSLMCIRQLCDTEPERASEALKHFSCFLRGNVDSLSNRGLIPFDREMVHVWDYLYLEKMRFKEKLNVRTEIEETDFMLPPLTLQPIVENAVHYGIMKKKGGGTITIRSSRQLYTDVITIIDDGAGFDLEQTEAGSRSHVGIENVRKRLEMQCGGSLLIQSERDVGTKVTIILPQGRESL